MKLIEGMKQLKILEKRIVQNTGFINDYAAIVSNERPKFANEQEQKKEIQGLLQANEDLAKQYLGLKKRIEKTNLETIVTIGKDSYAIFDLLIYRRGLAKLMRGSYMALNDKQAEQRLAQLTSRFAPAQTGEKAPHIDKMYDEKERNNALRRWQDLEDEIETRLEVINATTELLEL